MPNILTSIIIAIIIHPFHVSVCEIDHNPDIKLLQITHRIFIDDLEEGINLANAGSYELYEPENPDQIDKLISEYVQERFSVYVDGKKQEMNYLGHETDTEAVWCYIEIEKIKKFKSIEVHNTILMEVFPDQANIIHINYADQVKSIQLLGDKTYEAISF